MPVLDDLLTFLLTNNYGPASTERVVQIDEDLSPPCRAFYIEEIGVTLSYETSGGDVITDKLVGAQYYHAVRVRKFTNINGPGTTTPRIFAVW